MVNRGHRSLGCSTCRSSKVKCDQQRPACGRCIRAGRICSGYRAEEVIIAYRSDGSQLLRERLETWKPSARACQPATEARIKPCVSMVPHSPMQDMKVSSAWTDHSVGLFMTEYVEGPDHLGTGWGHFEYLPNLYDKTRTTYLTHAVHAAALVNAANASSITELKSLARCEYGKALQGLGAAMHNPRFIRLDETLATMNVLMTYEVIAGQRPIAHLWHAHFFGQSTFLHSWHGRQASHTSLFGITNRTLMWYDLVCATGPYLSVREWPASTYKSSLGETSARLTFRIVEVCGRVRRIFEESIHERSFAQLCQDALGLDHDLHAFFASTPGKWKAWTVSQRKGSVLDARASIHSMSSRVSAVPGRGLICGAHLRRRMSGTSQSYPSRVDVYPSKATAFLWGALRVAWIHLARALIDLHLFAQEHHYHHNLPPVEVIYTVIAELIEGICASVPYSLGDINQEGEIDTANCSRAACFHLIWLLHRLCDIPGLDPGLRAWIVSVFERIGERGVKRGHTLAELHRD